MKLTTKLGGGYIALSLLVLIAGIAGVYGVAKVESQLSYVAGPAWHSADSSIETARQTQNQFIEILKLIHEHTNADATEQNIAELDKIIDQKIAQLAENKLVPADLLNEVNQKRTVYQDLRSGLIERNVRFVKADKAMRDEFEALQKIMNEINEIGNRNFDALAKAPNRPVTWSNTIEELWNGANGPMLIQITILRLFYQYDRLLQHPELAEEVRKNLEELHMLSDKGLARFEELPAYQEVINDGEFRGRTLSEAVGEMLPRSAQLTSNAVNTFLTMVAARKAYEVGANELTATVASLEKLSLQEMQQQQAVVAGTRVVAYTVIAVVLLAGLAIAVVLGRYITRLIRDAFDTVIGVCRKMESGDLSEIEVAKTDDEIEDMLMAMKKMVAVKEDENNRLNESVIELLEATSKLSDRDLTVKVPVAEDVTGPIADAMNMMAGETARVLKDIRRVAEQVEVAANTVKQQGQKVSGVAAAERKMVEITIAHLEEASNTMNQIAKLAQACNDIATTASGSTDTALKTVNDTVRGMNEIRETISETEKRIKRLGERSQEISGIVDLINNIAERTHVLALNASMQAAAAGEAGRGFAVVADEVQRLAESSRNATSKISALVNNIQTETADTMNTMNKTISQVVEGSKLAEQAGRQMQETQQKTTKLVDSVAQIAERSEDQAKVSKDLRARAAVIQKSTQETGSELEEQTAQTESLVQYSAQLLDSVRVFKLPA
ncbi:MAG: methyl-accepting chemotaxis protein [Pseudomonadota bacterium]